MKRFIRFPSEAQYDRRLTKTDLLILLSICRHLNSKTNSGWPSQATIAKFALVGRQTVNRRIKHLVKTGWLRKKRRRRESGMLGSCEYTVLEATIPIQHRRGSAQKAPEKIVASRATSDDPLDATGVVVSGATGKEQDTENKTDRAVSGAQNSDEEPPHSNRISIVEWKLAKDEIRADVGERAYQRDLAKLTWKSGKIYAPSEFIARRIWSEHAGALVRYGIHEIVVS